MRIKSITIEGCRNAVIITNEPKPDSHHFRIVNVRSTHGALLMSMEADATREERWNVARTLHAIANGGQGTNSDISEWCDMLERIAGV